MCVTRKNNRNIIWKLRKVLLSLQHLRQTRCTTLQFSKMDEKEFKKEQRRQLMKMLETYGVDFPPDLIDELLCKINEIDRELKKK